MKNTFCFVIVLTSIALLLSCGEPEHESPYGGEAMIPPTLTHEPTVTDNADDQLDSPVPIEGEPSQPTPMATSTVAEDTQKDDTDGTPTDVAVSIESSPLATWDPSAVDGVHFTGGRGMLNILENCVTLRFDEGHLEILLIWPEPTSWNAALQTIEFVHPWSDLRLELRDGDWIGVTGNYIAVGSEHKYVVPPDESCHADEWIIVGFVDVPQE